MNIKEILQFLCFVFDAKKEMKQNNNKKQYDTYMIAVSRGPAYMYEPGLHLDQR